MPRASFEIESVQSGGEGWRVSLESVGCGPRGANYCALRFVPRSWLFVTEELIELHGLDPLQVLQSGCDLTVDFVSRRAKSEGDSGHVVIGPGTVRLVGYVTIDGGNYAGKQLADRVHVIRAEGFKPSNDLLTVDERVCIPYSWLAGCFYLPVLPDKFSSFAAEFAAGVRESGDTIEYPVADLEFSTEE